MDSACPPHWTFAARAAYFGDRMCSFCDHRNPAGAKFCNDCAAPLHLKPCKQCHAVDEQDATNCHECGAAYPVPFSTDGATTALRDADPETAQSPPGEVAAAATAKQPLLAASAFPVERRVGVPGRFVLAALALGVIAGFFAFYRINSATPDAMQDPSPAVDAAEHHTPAPPPAAVVVDSKPVEPDTTVAPRAPIPAIEGQASPRAGVEQRPERIRVTKRASESQRTMHAPATIGASAGPRPVRVPAANRATADQRRVPGRQAYAGASRPESIAAARARVRVAEKRKAVRRDPLQLMHVSLARCGGDFIARMVCDQRVRRHFCEGHWGAAPECPSGVTNDHGQ